MKQIRTIVLIRNHAGDIPAGTLLDVVNHYMGGVIAKHPDHPNMTVMVPNGWHREPFTGPSGLTAEAVVF